MNSASRRNLSTLNSLYGCPLIEKIRAVRGDDLKPEEVEEYLDIENPYRITYLKTPGKTYAPLCGESKLLFLIKEVLRNKKLVEEQTTATGLVLEGARETLLGSAPSGITYLEDHLIVPFSWANLRKLAAVCPTERCLYRASVLYLQSKLKVTPVKIDPRVSISFPLPEVGPLEEKNESICLQKPQQELF